MPELNGTSLEETHDDPTFEPVNPEEAIELQEIGPEDAEEPLERAGVLAAPTPVLARLQQAYASQNAATRRLTIPIKPGTYGGDLAFLAKPIEFERFRKEAEKMTRRGIASAEAESVFAAKTIAESCETILLSDEGDLVPMEEAVIQFKGTGPVRFDSRLCEALAIELPSSYTEPHQIVRLVYQNKQALQAVLHELLAFFGEETPGDAEDDAPDPT